MAMIYKRKIGIFNASPTLYAVKKYYRIATIFIKVFSLCFCNLPKIRKE